MASAPCAAAASTNSSVRSVRIPGFVIDDPKNLWVGRQPYEPYQVAHTPWEWRRPNIERAAAKGVYCFITPFADSAVDFLESLNVPAYKIASFENADLPLIKRMATTGNPMIISCSMVSAGEIKEAVQTARQESAIPTGTALSWDVLA